MSTALRRLIIMALGLLAGLAAWPVTELLLALQSRFPSYLVFSIAVGAAFGLVLGAFFGSGEGITSMIRKRIFQGAAIGAGLGTAGGILGFLVGQGLLFFLGEWLFRSNRDLVWIGLPIARGVGWSVLGLFVGMVDGVRTRSGKRVLVGAFGGLIGGLLGGFVLEYTRTFFPDILYARLAGLVLLGLLIGFFYGIVEKQLSLGVLRVLNGRLKGKEYLINQPRMRIGTSGASHIELYGYRNVADTHAMLRSRDRDVVIAPSAPVHPVYVNDDPVEEHTLKYEDVIKIGTVKLFYRHE